MDKLTIIYKVCKKLISGYLDHTKEQNREFQSKMTAGLVISNEKQLVDCQPLTNHIKENGLKRMCKFIKKKKYMKVLAVVEANALFPKDSNSRLCVEIE